MLAIVVVFLAFAVFLLFTGADELAVWVDLDLDLFAAGLLDFSFVVGPALFGGIVFCTAVYISAIAIFCLYSLASSSA